MNAKEVLKGYMMKALTKYEGRSLRILQVHTLYPTYVPKYYELFPQEPQRSHATQVQNLYDHGLQEMYIVAPLLKKMGCETQLVYSNAYHAQHAWCVENGFPVDVFSHPSWEQKILAAQVENFKPDVLFFSDNHNFDGVFIQNLSFTPRLTVAWRYAPIDLSTQWQGYDILLSGSQRYVNLASQLGPKKALRYNFGLPTFLKGATQQKDRDLIFCGTYRSPFAPTCHSRRRQLLDEATKTCLDEKASFHFYLTDVTKSLPEKMQKVTRAPLYGKGMYKEISKSLIGIDSLGNGTANIHGHPILQLTAGDTINMRLVEHLCCQTLAFTEERGRLAQSFEPMREVVTYSSFTDFSKKLRYYLKNKEEAQVIIQQGSARVQKDLNQTKTLTKLLEIFQQGLEEKKYPEKMQDTVHIPPVSVLQKMLKLLAKFPADAGKDAWELEEHLFKIACVLAAKGEYARAFELDSLINSTPLVQADMRFLKE